MHYLYYKGKPIMLQTLKVQTAVIDFKADYVTISKECFD